MTTNLINAARWENYVLQSGSHLTEFWQEHLSAPRKILFVLGKGFDSRMCIGITNLIETQKVKDLTVLAVAFEEGELSPSRTYSPKVEENWQKLEKIIEGIGELREHSLKMWSEDRRRIGSRNAAQIFTKISNLNEYTDIIVDVSAMPRSVYLPLIASVLHFLDDNSSNDTALKKLNLHVWVCENALLDASTKDEEIDELADFIHGFRGGFDMESTANRPRVWIPILGEDQRTQLERIYELITPDEICPVLPAPALDPRRGDDLVLEYRELLFDLLRVEPQNFIYAAERNPFEVYRQIRRTVLHYKEALNPLGGCKTVVSALSSKLMSLGALLVAYELKQSGIEIGIAHIEANGYKMDDNAEDTISSRNELFGLWIFGECYESS